VGTALHFIAKKVIQVRGQRLRSSKVKVITRLNAIITAEACISTVWRRGSLDCFRVI